MSGELTTSTPSPSATAFERSTDNPAVSDLERVREVLIGDQWRKVEQTIRALEADMQALRATQEALARRLDRLADTFRRQLRAARVELTGRFDQLSAAIAEQGQALIRTPSPPRSIVRRGEWVRRIEQWKHVRAQPERAREIIEFFQHAFEWLPEQTLLSARFGVHTDHISLTIGNIRLASLSASTRTAQILVDQAWNTPAKLTRRYVPLGWKVRSWARLGGWNQSADVWVSYAEAAEKVWATPIARAVIRRNLANKQNLRDIVKISRPRRK